VASQGISVLGATGSIGVSTLKVLAGHTDRYHVVALSADKNYQRLAEQCKQHRARYAVINDASLAVALRSALDQLGCRSEVLAGREALSEVVRLDETETAVTGE